MKVYFFQIRNDGPIKIGSSRNPENRLKSLNQSSPYQMRMLGTIEATNGEEGKMHKRFSKYRIRGEWFHPAKELIEYVKTLPMNKIVVDNGPKPLGEIRDQAFKDWINDKAKERGSGE
jgi:hypothetical protein